MTSEERKKLAEKVDEIIRLQFDSGIEMKKGGMEVEIAGEAGYRAQQFDRWLVRFIGRLERKSKEKV